MRLFVFQGKGQRDRWITSTTVALDELRTYFKEYKPEHPDGYLFLSDKNGVGSECISERSIRDAFARYLKRGRISYQRHSSYAQTRICQAITKIKSHQR